MDRLVGSVSMPELFAVPPDLLFPAERGACPLCGGALKVRKTVTRTMATMDIGSFVAHETVMGCDRCPGRPSFRSAQLAALVAPGCRFGYDVMVFAGLSVFGRLQPAAHVVAELRARRIGISESEVRELGARFVVSLGFAHAEAAPRLRAHLGLNGGYILHLDSTCQKGSRHLMTGLDELSGMVLLNAAMGTENSIETAAFLRDLVARYGPPAAVSCDRSKGILGAVESELAGVPVFLCHFHFLRDLGKNLMEEDYRTVREGLARHGPLAKLRRLQRDLDTHLDGPAPLVEAMLGHIGRGEPVPRELAGDLPPEAVLGTLIDSIFEAKRRGDGCGFPFDRPHLHCLRQMQTVRRAVEALLECRQCGDAAKKHFKRALAVLSPVCADAAMATAAERVERRARVFDRLRIAMRIAEPESGAGLNDQGSSADIHAIERAVAAFRDDLLADPALAAEPAFARMLAQIAGCSDRLFCDPLILRTPAGPRLVQPHRTNNILEQFFRSLNRDCRKRTGHQLTGNELDRMQPDLPLVRNLDDSAYLDILLDGAATLAERLAKLDRSLVTASLEAARRERNRLSRSARKTLRANTTPLQIAVEILASAVKSN